MRRLSFLFLSVVLLVSASCHRPSLDDLSDESARYAAEFYYAMLVEGRFDEYVAAMEHSGEMRPEMRSQMVALMAQFVDDIKMNKGGLVSAKATSDSLSGNEACVFLDVLYADSTQERVAFPMVFQQQWKIR